MSRPSHLIRLTHILLMAAVVLSGFIAGLLVLALGGLAVAGLNLDGRHLGLPDMIEGVARGDMLAMATPLLLAGIACLTMTALAFHQTARIVRTAMTGDPFVAGNAVRLTRIAWYLLAVQMVGLLIHVVMGGFPEKARAHIHFSFNVSPMGLLAILLIFVLAQVFRRGAEMRDELEGTV